MLRFISKQRVLQAAKATGCLFLAFSLGACTLMPNYERPQQQLPTSWRNIQLDKEPLNTDWWTRFKDPVLTQLVEEALAKNQDLSQALANIESAAAQAGVGASAGLPQIAAVGSADAQSLTEKSANTVPFSQSGYSRQYTSYQGALTAGWEIDLWGKIRSSYTVLTNIMFETLVSREALRLSVSAEVAQNYFALLALDMQLETSKRTLRTRQESLNIYTSRYSQGEITELDWQRAKAEVETARTQVHTTKISLEQTEVALAILTGRSPKDVFEMACPRGKAIHVLPAPPVLPEGLPSLLLERRPDVRAAEYALIASNAQIGVARASFFPSISLTGSLGTLSAATANLFTNPAAMWSYGITGSLPILDGGRNWYNLKDAEAQKRAAIAVYCKTVQTAFGDVRSAFSAQQESKEIAEALQRQVDSLRRASEIARIQYDNGYTDYLTVLDADRALFSAELSLADALRGRLDAVVGVCKALGGGWQDPHASTPYPCTDPTKMVEAQKKGARAIKAEGKDEGQNDLKP